MQSKMMKYLLFDGKVTAIGNGCCFVWFGIWIMKGYDDDWGLKRREEKGFQNLVWCEGSNAEMKRKKKNREPIIANVVSEIGFSHSFIIFPPYFNCPNGRTDLTHLSFLSVLFNAFSSPSYRILGSNIFEFPYLLKVILTFLDYNR